MTYIHRQPAAGMENAPSILGTGEGDDRLTADSGE
jgi:hypothetical protein